MSCVSRGCLGHIFSRRYFLQTKIEVQHLINSFRMIAVRGVKMKAGIHPFHRAKNGPVKVNLLRQVSQLFGGTTAFDRPFPPSTAEPATNSRGARRPTAEHYTTDAHAAERWRTIINNEENIQSFAVKVTLKRIVVNCARLSRQPPLSQRGIYCELHSKIYSYDHICL